MFSGEQIKTRVTYHAPSADGVRRHKDLSSAFELLMQQVDSIVPDGREKSLVITKLEEGKMWASAGVARNESTR